MKRRLATTKDYCQTCGQRLPTYVNQPDKWLALVGQKVLIKKSAQPRDFRLYQEWTWKKHLDLFKKRTLHVADLDGDCFWGFPPGHAWAIHYKYRKTDFLRVVR